MATSDDVTSPRMTVEDGEAFARGNAALRGKDYTRAMSCYLAAPFQDESLGRMIGLNAVLARQGRRREQARASGLRVAVCGWDLSAPGSQRTLELGRLYETFAHTEIIGSVFARRGKAKLWAGLGKTSIPVRRLDVADPARFIELAQAFVVSHPCDVLHISNPMAANILLALLYRLVWDSRIIVDIEADELAGVHEATAVTIEDYLHEHESLPALQDLNGEDWTRLSVGLMDDFDFLTVPTEEMRKRCGGSVVSGDVKLRPESVRRLRLQCATLPLHHGRTSSAALRLMQSLPEGRRLHAFGVLLDVFSARLGKAPPARIPRARISGTDAGAERVPPPVALAAAKSQLAKSEPLRDKADSAWTRAADFRDFGEGTLLKLAGEPLGFLRNSDASSQTISTIRAFCRIHGLTIDEFLASPVLGAGGPQPAGATSRTAVIPVLEAVIRPIGRMQIAVADVWYTSDFSLRFRFEPQEVESLRQTPCVLRCYQLDAVSKTLCLLSEALVDGSSFADIRLLNPLSPLLISMTDAAGAVQSLMLLPFPSLCRGGWHHGELAAMGSRPDYMANLFSNSGALLAEFLAAGRGVESFSIAALDVDLQGATGAEKIFSAPVQSWLSEVIGISIVPPDGNVPHSDHNARLYLESAITAAGASSPSQSRRITARKNEGCFNLRLPADSLPTISALVSRRLSAPEVERCASGSYILAHPTTGKPQSVVTLPALGEGLLALQPRDIPVCFPVLHRVDSGGAPPSAIEALSCPPLAVCYREPPRNRTSVLLAPIASDGSASAPLRRTLTEGERQEASISVLLAARTTDDHLQTFVEALSRQTMAQAVDVVVAAHSAVGACPAVIADLLDRHFPSRWTWVEVDDNRSNVLLNAAAGKALGRRLLLADVGTVMHEPRTLETLYVMCLHDRVATAGCVLLREEAFKKGTEVRFHSGGFYPSHVSLLGAPHLVFSEPYTLAAFPGATYPVVGNTFRLSMVKADVWSEIGGLDVSEYAYHRHDLDFCLRAHVAGYSHLCTAAVTASCLNDGGYEHHVDSHSLRQYSPKCWQNLLSTVTLLYDAGA